MNNTKTTSDLAPELWQKLGGSLQRALRSAVQSSGLLHVMISLQTEPPDVDGLAEKTQRVRAMREAFETQIRPFVRMCAAEGGTDFRVQWIAGAVTARLPVAALLSALQNDRVTRVDLVENKQGLI